MAKERLFIIDGFSHIFRAYYAIRNLDNNAVYGFTMMLKKILETEKPEYITVALDAPGPSFRSDIYPEYKANRQAAPEDLKAQIPLIKNVISAFGVTYIEQAGYEADDIIGTLCVQAKERGLQAVIASSDKDMLQLVSGQDVVMYDPKKGLHYLGEEGIPDYFGCNADQIIDLLMIWGDSSDNIPGVSGIGEKGAKTLLKQSGSIDGIYAHMAEIKRKKYREGLEAFRERMELTRTLVTIKTDLDLGIDVSTMINKPLNQDTLRDLFRSLRFDSLVNELPIKLETRSIDYPTTDSLEKIDAWIEKINTHKFFVFDLETTSLDPREADILGVAIATSVGDATYIPLRHRDNDATWCEQAEAKLKTLMSDPQLKKCAHNLKFDYSMLNHAGWSMAGTLHDTMAMSYLIDATDTRHGLDELAMRRLNYQTIKFEEVTGGVENGFAQVSVADATQYAAEDADVCFRLYERLMPIIEKQGLKSVYETIELPLIPVLSHMEAAGVRLDCAHLERMSQQINGQLIRIQQDIYDQAGEKFNIGSSKQVGRILFEKLELPVQGKTAKTKSYSTSQQALERLSAMGYDIATRLLDYRMLSKLQSTYVEKLPDTVHPKTGRIHSEFNQFVTATGRLSSANPNLQNIPIRSSLGEEIRAAFLPREGWDMIAADYSQIELRLLAHFSEDRTLVDGFKRGEDIHRRTASEVMDVPLDQVDAHMRAAAKSINFGLIYGMGDFRLSRELGITRKQARAYMDTYFEKMPSVPEFQAHVINKAREHGEVRTHYGRRRLIPEINSRNKTRQRQGERLAINTLIQGTAAEIIKLAMIRLEKMLKQQGSQARMLLQVHDELVLESPPNETQKVMDTVKEAMEGVTSFKVPLIVQCHTGNNWKEAK